MKFLLCLAILAAQGQTWRVKVHVTARGPVSIPLAAPTVRVVHRGVVLPSQISEELEAGEAGSLSWFAAAAGDYDVYYKHEPHLQTRREPIGNGDNLFYNRPDALDSLGIGMKNDQVFPIDWDGDGRTDLLQRNIYSATYGQPWWGLYFWRNIGTEAKPRFARAIRLRAAGQWIADFYASYQITDWDGDGRMDILSGARNQLKVYRNTGRRDSNRLPILENGPALTWQGGAELTYGMRLLGDSLFTLKVNVQYFPNQETSFKLFRHPRTPTGFGNGEPVTLAGKTEWPEWPSDRMDVNGDGVEEWIGATRGPGHGPLKTCIVAWQKDDAAKCLVDTSPEGFAIPLSAAPWPGIFVSHQGSWMRWFVQKAGAWVDQGMLQAQGQPVSSGGYTGLEVVDWDHDGDLDLVMGNETGFVHWAKNVSRPGRIMFQAPRKLMYTGRSLFIDDEDPERPFGQAKPTVVDWDGDGDLDVLVGNNSNRIAYFERDGAGFKPMLPLRHDNGERFSFRAQPSAVDWNGDGLLDLIAGSSIGINRNTGPDIAISLYLRYRAPSGELRLGPPQTLRSVEGAELRTPIPYHHGFTAVDWDADGDLDIFASEKSHVVLYRNEGGRFRREAVRVYGEPLTISHHETSVRAVDWDKDGQLDLLLGGESGRVYYFHRTTLEAKAKPVVTVGREERVTRLPRGLR